MPTVRGCYMPDELLYDVDNHIWFQEQGDGTVKVGMTAVATAMAGKLVAFTPKRVGRSVRAGKSCGTLESGKWVGPAKSAAAGEVATRAALSADASTAAIAWWSAVTGDGVRIEVFDATTGAPGFDYAQSGTNGVQNFPAALAATPDGRRVVAALWGAQDTRPEVVLLDRDVGGPVLSADFAGSALGVAVEDAVAPWSDARAQQLREEQAAARSGSVAAVKATNAEEVRKCRLLLLVALETSTRSPSVPLLDTMAITPPLLPTKLFFFFFCDDDDDEN